jgi:hypothetical protein
MDAHRFDLLTKVLSARGARRGLIGLLASLPVIGGLAGLDPGDETVEAKGRRKRRKKKHKHGRPRSHGKRKKKKCKPKSLAKTCEGKCGSVKNNCKRTVDCGSCGCSTLCDPGQCCAGTCVDIDTSHDHCGSCGNACAANEICVDGACQTCHVCAADCPFTTVHAAVAAATSGDTLYLCPGAYAGGLDISKPLTLIGAGQGTDGAILDGPSPGAVVVVRAGTEAQPMTLRGLRIQNASLGVVVDPGQHLVMTACTVRKNIGNGGIFKSTGSLLMTACTIAENEATAPGQGGGLRLSGGPATLIDCLVEGNKAAIEGGGIDTQNAGAILTLRNTRVSGNFAPTGSGIHTSGGVVSLEDGSVVCGNDPTATQCDGFADPTNACQVTCPPA